MFYTNKWIFSKNSPPIVFTYLDIDSSSVLISQVRIALHYILSDHFKNIPSDKLELIILKSLENIIDSDTPMFVFSNNITDTLDKILIIAIRKSFDIIYKSLNNIRKETYNLIVLKV